MVGEPKTEEDGEPEALVAGGIRMGVAPLIIPFKMGIFHERNHPAIGDSMGFPICGKPKKSFL